QLAKVMKIEVGEAGAFDASGPGRPLGSRNKLSEDFLCDMHVAWTEHASAVLDRIITDRPEIFFLAMTKLAQIYRVELGKPQELGGPCSREEALRRLEERSGSKARKMFERFLARIDKLECSEEEVGAQPIPDGGSVRVRLRR